MQEVEQHYEVMDVPENCSLKQFIEETKGENSYDRGYSYYELTEDAVDIDSGKEVMFLDKVNSNNNIIDVQTCYHDAYVRTTCNLEWKIVPSTRKNWSTWNIFGKFS